MYTNGRDRENWSLLYRAGRWWASRGKWGAKTNGKGPVLFTQYGYSAAVMIHPEQWSALNALTITILRLRHRRDVYRNL